MAVADSGHVVQTVGSLIQMVLPRGTNVQKIIAAFAPDATPMGHPKYQWCLAPHMPTDLFAVSGYLCKVGGVVGFFNPSPYGVEGQNCEFVFDRTYRDQMDKVAEHWRGAPKKKTKPQIFPPDEVQTLWDELLAHWDHPINSGFYTRNSGDFDPNAKPAPWWRLALSLVMIADMVCARVVRDDLPDHTNKVLGGWLEALYHMGASDLVATTPSGGPSSGPRRNKGTRPPASFTFLADTGVVCVMPKLRVASVGATLRNVSRNLALLPGRGEMRCYWDITDAALKSEDLGTLDILLIPQPITMNAMDFSAEQPDPAASMAGLHKDKPNWENFALNQSWLAGENGEAVIESCVNLLKAAKVETGSVNAVILPEYSLTYVLFDKLCERLKREEKNLEFVISGSSDNCDCVKANTILTRVWQAHDPTTHVTNSRRKHHRWRLDRRQVETYALGTALNPKIRNWWEATPIGQREMYFHRFRKSSTFAALICEELARSDACHEILRAVGPNLVFALLMDGPQIKERWPAQYAANLADDPGCAVLTFTSYGLIDRSNRQGHHPENHSVALWKDDTGRIVQVPMPKGSGPRGILLSLWSEHVQDLTMTGKQSLVRAWRYSSHYPVVLPSVGALKNVDS